MAKKFRLKVRKMKCVVCDTITLVEFKQPVEALYSCPLCMETMDNIDDITIAEEKKL